MTALIGSSTSIQPGARISWRPVSQTGTYGSTKERVSLSSTTPFSPPKEIGQRIEELFASSVGTLFEDGMESEFSRELSALIQSDEANIEVIANLVIGGSTDSEVASEALRWIGRVEHRRSYQRRRWLLERALRHPSARVRDGALLGLAFMDDPHSIPYLQRAIGGEPVIQLCVNMQQVLSQLLLTKQDEC